MTTKKQIKQTIRFIKDRWLPALRSGKYDQAMGVLRFKSQVGSAAEYCCLGVACNLENHRRWDRNSGWAGNDDTAVEELLDNPYWPMPAMTPGEMSMLSKMNDGGGVVVSSTFSEIAEWVEQNVLPRLRSDLK